ncbi:related to MET12-methylenetetrahydrofolate reductase [Serendipita indica DSM 11827]|uniref:Related to MET12-methylenetetrahydrofolate reductase n=1 Tax=Serendipita indica (strain DSM 11827) TaxID=1109443 RepID=G4TRD0_SERID|nr:related to MET12-methylenetetrahydrofolate reductase [Serendipita indica DSM 11827]
MRLSEKIDNLDSFTPFYTFEFFPPRTEQGFENLVSRIGRLSTLNPLAVSITWGAGGSTKDWSLKLADICRNDHSVDTIMHLTCTNMQPGMVEDALRTAMEKGIRNILALRGDPPRGADSWIPSDPRFTSATDLVKFIKTTPEFRDYFCIGVAGYPDGHAETTASEEEQIQYLKKKVDAGADFIITQLFYDPESFLTWQENVRKAGIKIPVIPGIMPIQTYASFMRLIKLCGTKVPDSLMAQITPIRNDDQLVKDLGVEVAVSMIRKLQQSGVQGFHFCTFNLEKSVQRVLEQLGWVGRHVEQHNMVISESPSRNNQPGSLPPELVITASDIAASTSYSLKQAHPGNGPNNSAGKGELNAAGTWDEFPNGRFGDFKSPAFGVKDLWDHGITALPRNAVELWGRPTHTADITTVFLRYLRGEVPSTPWSDSPLSPESKSLVPLLTKLNERGWWTVGSQPAVDAVPSEDEVHGWGPRGGYVFQKAFVEFFCTRDDVAALEARAKEKGKGWVTFFAANMMDDYATNMTDEGSNAVTWGVFPGKEINSPTIIERDSFLAWKDEAFGYWTEWGLFYPPDSAERKLLDSVRDERWLISLVHHNFKDPDGLWNFLLD